MTASLPKRSASAAQAYAEALLPLAIAADALESTADELEQAAELLDREELWAGLLASPLMNDERKIQSAERAFRGHLSDLTCDALLVFLARGRIGLLGEIAATFRALVREAQGTVAVEVTTAVPMDEPTRQVVSRGVQMALGRQPFLHEHVQADILGGLILQVGDTVTDMSVRRQLQRFAATLGRSVGLARFSP